MRYEPRIEPLEVRRLLATGARPDGFGAMAMLLGATVEAGGQRPAASASTANLSRADHTPPTITLQAEAPGWLSRTDVTITGQIADDRSGVATLRARVDGGGDVVVPFDPAGNFTFTTALPLDGSADGFHWVEFVAADNAGNASDPSFAGFVLDSLPPTIELTAMPRVLNSSPVVSGSVSDALSGVAALQAQVDGGPAVAIPVDAAGSFSFPVGLRTDGTQDGPHTVAFWATDRAGNVATDDFDFTLDTRPPTVTISSPDPDLATRTNITVTGQATDAGSGVTSMTAQVDGAAPVGISFDGSGQFRFATGLLTDGSQDGWHTVTFQATDAAGNLSSPVAYTFLLGTKAPTLSLASPAGGTTLAPGATLVGVVTTYGPEPAAVDYSFDGGTPIPVAFNPADGSFRQVLSLSDLAAGDHHLVVSADDAAGNTASQAIDVTLAQAYPHYTVAWINPAGGNWSDPNNWDTGRVPGPDDDVLIDVPGNVSVIYDQGDTTIHSLLSQDALTLAGGDLGITDTAQVSSTFTIAGGTLSRAHVLRGGGGQGITFTSAGGTLDGVTTDADLDLATHNRATAIVVNGLTLAGGATVLLGNGAGTTSGSLNFDGTQTLAGTGTVLFGKLGNSDALKALPGVTLTLGGGITVRGSSGFIGGSFIGTGVVVINQGTIAGDDSGGAPGFAYDMNFGGGSTGKTSDPIDTSGVAGPAPQAVYQTYRTGGSFYTLTGLTPGAAYTLRLHFADPISTAVGQRRFNVITYNGTQALSDFDIFAAAGGKDRATVQTLAATADGQGHVILRLGIGVAGVPLINGIEAVSSGGATVLAINCGSVAGGKLTISADTFINEGTIQTANAGSLAISGLTGNLGAVTIGGSGSLSLTGTNYVIDQGLTTSGQTLTLNGTWSNAAGSTIVVDGGTVDLGNSSNAWSNAGTIAASNASVNLGGSFTLAALGNFQHPGSVINLTGTLDNTGTVLSLDSSTGSWNLAGGTLKNGTYRASDGAKLVFNRGGTLDGVTAESDLDLTSVVGAGATIKNGLTLADGVTVRLGDARGTTSGSLGFSGTQTLGGTGTVLFGKYGSGNQMLVFGGSTLTLGSGITVRGASSSKISGNALVNLGTIVADPDGSLGTILTISPTTFTNQGTLLATNGGSLVVGGLTGNLNSASLDVSGKGLILSGTNYTVNRGLAAVAGQTLTLGGTWSNAAGSAIAASGATLNLGNSRNAWSNEGTIAATNSTLNLGGSFTAASLAGFQRNGGTVNLTGTLDATGAGLALDATTGSWNLARGTLKNGTYSAGGGAELVFTSSGGTLDGVTAESDLDLASNSGATATVKNGLTLGPGATVRLGNSAGTTSGSLTFSGTQTLGGTGTVLFGKSAVNTISASTGSTLSLGSGIVLIGSSGRISGGTIVNQGMIAVDASGGGIGTLTINPTTFTNQGTLQATGGEAIGVSGLAPNTGTISVGIGSKVVVTGGFTQAATATLEVSVAGTAPGQYGVLTVSGATTLAGTLDVRLVNGYSPTGGDSIPVITYSSEAGQFDTVNILNLPPGIAMSPAYNATNVALVFGNALEADATSPAAAGGAPDLTSQELAPLVAAAVARWAAAGVEPAALARMARVDLRIADLPGADLGMQAGPTLWIDGSAAGYGWFVDPTPADDAEFDGPAAAGERIASRTSPAAGKIDLLTVLVHELGHELGLAHSDAPGDVMGEVLPVGYRRLGSARDIGSTPAAVNSIRSTLPAGLASGTSIPPGISMSPTAGALPRGQEHTFEVLDLLLQDRDVWPPLMPCGRRRAARSSSSSG